MQKYTIGIFWYIDRSFLTKLQKKEPDALSLKTGKVDGDYAHYYVWDELCATFPDSDFASSSDIDFATFPRGRVLYDIKKRSYILYSDLCIPDQRLDLFAKEHDLLPYMIARDEHYRCDKCMGTLLF